MKHLKKAEQRLSDTRGFLWVYGVMSAVPEVLKKILLLLWKRSTEIIMVAALLGIVGVYRAMDGGAISYACALLFVAVLAILFIALIKIKILEAKNKNRHER